MLKPDQVGQVAEQQITDWSHEHVAAYKVPRIVQFSDALPASGTGKVMWRMFGRYATPGLPRLSNATKD